MPWSKAQLEVFRIRAHDLKLSARERNRYRKLYEEGIRMQKKPGVPGIKKRVGVPGVKKKSGVPGTPKKPGIPRKKSR